MSDLFAPDAKVAEEFRTLLADPAAREAFTELRHEAAENGAKTRYQHVLKAVSGSAWAIRPEYLALIVDLLAFRIAGGRLSPDEIQARIGSGRTQVAEPPAGVAVLPLHGVIMPKASAMSDVSGATSIEAFRSQFRHAMAAENVSGIVLDVDSPGGMVDGVPEMAAEIRDARGTKPIVAVANTQASSAAYWLAAQADELVATRSGRVGSVGVYAAHEDESAKAENEGVKTTLVSAGRFKTEGNPFEPLTDEGRAHLQTMVDAYYGMFTADVAAGRGVTVSDVLAGFGEGREVLASEALSVGMVDRIASTEQIAAEMLGAAKLRAATNDYNVAFTPEPTFGAVTDGWGDPEFVSAVDNSTWDANTAMGQCSTAADYRSICAGETNTGDPDQRQHWKLPHHYLGRGPNAAGVQAALGRFNQTQGLTNSGAARSHLEAHQRSINPDSNATALTPEREDELSLRAVLDSLQA